MRVEDHSIVHVHYRNGLRGLLEIGIPVQGARPIRLIGSEGFVELNGPADGRPVIRARVRDRADWLVPETDESIHDRRYFTRAVLDLNGALDTGRPPELRGERARKTIEIIVAAYESAYRRGRIDLPLVDVLDCPLERLTAPSGA